MTPETWTAVDRYFEDQLLAPDPVLQAVLAASDAAGLPSIAVSPSQGKLLQLLAQLAGARRVLEIGTLGGYSTLWLARALPAGGRIVTLELEPKHAAVARSNFAAAGVADVIELRLGPAADSLRALVAEKSAAFDLVFIDADKASSAEYFGLSLQLSRPGTLLLVDNIVRKGAVVDGFSTDGSVRGIRRLMADVKASPRVDAVGLQTVGVKGYDGLLIARVK